MPRQSRVDDIFTGAAMLVRTCDNPREDRVLRKVARCPPGCRVELRDEFEVAHGASLPCPR